MTVYTSPTKGIKPGLFSPFKAAFDKGPVGRRPPEGGPGSELQGAGGTGVTEDVLLGESLPRRHRPCFSRAVSAPAHRGSPHHVTRASRHQKALEVASGGIPDAALVLWGLLVNRTGSCCLPRAPAPHSQGGETGLGTPKRPVFCFTPTLDLARTAGRWIY